MPKAIQRLSEVYPRLGYMLAEGSSITARRFSRMNCRVSHGYIACQANWCAIIFDILIFSYSILPSSFLSCNFRCYGVSRWVVYFSFLLFCFIPWLSPFEGCWIASGKVWILSNFFVINWKLFDSVLGITRAEPNVLSALNVPIYHTQLEWLALARVVHALDIYTGIHNSLLHPCKMAERRWYNKSITIQPW